MDDNDIRMANSDRDESFLEMVPALAAALGGVGLFKGLGNAGAKLARLGKLKPTTDLEKQLIAELKAALAGRQKIDDKLSTIRKQRKRIEDYARGIKEEADIDRTVLNRVEVLNNLKESGRRIPGRFMKNPYELPPDHRARANYADRGFDAQVRGQFDPDYMDGFFVDDARKMLKGAKTGVKIPSKRPSEEDTAWLALDSERLNNIYEDNLMDDYYLEEIWDKIRRPYFESVRPARARKLMQEADYNHYIPPDELPF